MAGDREEGRWDVDLRRIELDYQMEFAMCATLKEESDSAPDDPVLGALVPSRGERRILSHVWAHLNRQVMREPVLRQSEPAPSGLTKMLGPDDSHSRKTGEEMTAAEQGGRPRANRAVDWNRRPPAEVVVAQGLFSG